MWTPTKNQKFGVVTYNFHHDGIRQSLHLDIGETVQILEESNGWYRGFSTRNRNVRGIFPSSYIHLRPFRIDNEGISPHEGGRQSAPHWLYETVTPVEDGVVQEVASILWEWGQIWKDLYVVLGTPQGNQELWDALRKAMMDLADWRKQLVMGTLTSDQIAQLKLKITRRIDWGNRKLGLDLVPRIEGEMVDPDRMSVVELHQVHVQSAETSKGHSSSTGTLGKKREKRKILSHHLFFCMRAFSYHLGEDTEIFFSLYDAKQSRFISERFLVKLSKEGFSNYIDCINSNCTVFTDLGSADLDSELYIVTQVIRIGRMMFSESGKKTSVQNFRRPYGVALFKLTSSLLKGSDGEVELSGKLFSSDEKDFWQLHELILKKQSNKYSILSNTSYGLVVSVKVLHGELEQATKENPLLLKNVCITKKLGFSDVIMPGDVRNDLYITLSHGEFERGGKSTGKNIEVSVHALDYEGQPIECIYSGTGHDGTTEFSSMVMYHNNSPRWSERLKIAIPIDKFSGAHLRLEFRHCSTREKGEKKMFGFSFVRLMDDEAGTTLRDGAHELCVYKCDDRSKLSNPEEYITMPFITREAVECIYSLPFQRSTKEVMVINTLLCSTKLTQNVDLLSLLRWRSAPDGIGETLSRVSRVDGAETVKFLQDVLDALFAMFSTEDGNSTQHSGHVFQALVSIFSLLEDSKFEHFKPVMDAYITGHFAAALVYKGLISCVRHLSDLCPQTDKQDPILRCFRSLEYIFKFIIQSRLLFARATGGQNEDSFRIDVECLFKSCATMLSVQASNILQTQVTLLENIHGASDQLARVMTAEEVVAHVSSLLNALPQDLPRELGKAKLKAIKNAINSTLFEDDEGRGLLLETVCSCLRLHLDSRLELSLCAEILSDILILTHKHTFRFPHNKLPPSLHMGVETVMLSLADVVIQVILSLDTSAPNADSLVPGLTNLTQFLSAMKSKFVPTHAAMLLGSLGPSSSNVEILTLSGTFVACLMGVFQLMNEKHYARLWEFHSNHGTHNLRHLLHSVIILLADLVKTAVFPPDWFVMRMVTNHTILTAMQEIAQPLILSFLKQGNFDNQLWSTYLNLAVGFLTQPCLQLEQFSQQKRHKVLERYNDMRVLMGFQILSMWHNLDEHRLHFIPGMVGPFLEVTLVPEPELRKATLPIFFDMMQAEQQAKGNFKQVETELIDKLDILISENKGDDEYRQLFNTMEHLSAVLLERVRSDDPVWRDSGTAFINSVTRLLERLLDYRNVMQGDENCDKRMSCTVNLLNFYKNEINRQEMYVRYIYKLHDLHLPVGNYTEAAFTLQLHAAQLSWSNRMLHADHLYPAQTETQRKEQIYRQIVNYFDKGKCWEEGIPLLEELAVQYKLHIFDYKKLSEVLKQQAEFYEKILKGGRYDNEYFRVGFYGFGLPLFVRNKVFIYRGLEYEQITAFTQRITNEFPQAKLLSHNTPPDDAIRSSDSQYIQICAVKPVAAPKPEFDGGEVDERILKYYMVNHIKHFTYDRPTYRGQPDKENEVKNLWIERITYVTESELPGILKWFEVVEQRVEQLSPPQYACETVHKNNSHIRQMINHYRVNQQDNIQPFTMRLQGTIDAAVNGGIAKYQEAFFGSEYLLINPEFTEHVTKLKGLISEQTMILEVALELHGKIAPAANQPLHKRLIEVFEGLRTKVRKMCSTPQSQRSSSSLQSTPHTHRRADSDPAQEFRRIGSIINSPLPPLPSDKKEMSGGPSSSTSGNSSLRSSQASSLYGHFQAASHDDDLYAKPQEWEESLSAFRDTRPRSALITDSRGSSPKSLTRSLNNDYIIVPPARLSDERQRWRHSSRPPSPRRVTQDSLNTSWSDSHGSHESLPPLPPRGGEKTSRSVSLGGEDDQPPPVLPKRMGKKCTSPAMFGSDLLLSESDSGVSNGFLPTTPDTPPLVSPRNHRTPPPPPIPPKTSSTPLTPVTPTSGAGEESGGDRTLLSTQDYLQVSPHSSLDDLTPTTPTNHIVYEVDTTRHSLADNYSVPPRLQPPPSTHP
ncbi:dedicator of cytokinesis protein 3-like isoform X2 [Oratosquilla oratoria]|uniref:dedicator of cytokinesis protein 3-like isoform X2 n=1 Tax=Oratosquilla oratoria TaxID=337810 RepID=UPI003F759ED2